MNIIIGTDKYGHKLQLGDICLFKVKLQGSKNDADEMKGMIVYDEDSYSFAFETLEDNAPLLLMNCAELGSIEKLYEANINNLSNISNGNKWKKIYNNNVIIK